MPLLRVTTKAGPTYVIDTEKQTWFRVNSTERIDEDKSPIEGTINTFFNLELNKPMMLLGPDLKILNTSIVTNITGPGYGERDYTQYLARG